MKDARRRGEKRAQSYLTNCFSKKLKTRNQTFVAVGMEEKEEVVAGQSQRKRVRVDDDEQHQEHKENGGDHNDGGFDTESLVLLKLTPIVCSRQKGAVEQTQMNQGKHKSMRLSLIVW